VGAITEFVAHTIEAGARADDLANRLGLDVVQLQKFQLAAQLAGVDAEGAAHSLGFLNKAVGEAISGEGGSKEAAETFAKLGISLKDASGQTRDVGDILNDTADALAKLPDQQTRAAYAMKLFSREGQRLLPLLAQGSAGLREVAKEFDELGGGMSKDFVDHAKKADDTIQMVKFGLNSLRVRIVSGLLPAVQSMANKAKDWVKGLIDWADKTNVLKTLTIAFTSFLAIKMVTTLIRLAKIFGLLSKVTEIWKKGLLAFSAPLLIIGGLYLAFDELYTLLNGGDTVLGDILEKFGGVEGKNKFVNDLKDSWALLKTVWDSFTPDDKLSAMAVTLRVIAQLVSGIVVSFKTLFDTVALGSEIMTKFFQGWRASGGVDTSALQRDMDAFRAIGNLGLPPNHPAVNTVPANQGAPGGRVHSMPKPGEPGYGVVDVPDTRFDIPGPQILAPTSMKNTFHINVTAAKNPEDTGKRIASAAASELETQNYNTSLAMGAL
jgi:hypothetical protein